MLVEQGITSGPANFIQKPFTSEILRERIRNLLKAP
jgi:hypothetical protein